VRETKERASTGQRPRPYEAGRATEAEEQNQGKEDRRNRGGGTTSEERGQRTESEEKRRLEVVPVSGFM